MSAHASLGHEFLLWEETLNHIRRYDLLQSHQRRGDKAKQSQARIREQTGYRGRVTREMAAAPLTCLLHKFSPRRVHAAEPNLGWREKGPNSGVVVPLWNGLPFPRYQLFTEMGLYRRVAHLLVDCNKTGASLSPGCRKEAPTAESSVRPSRQRHLNDSPDVCLSPFPPPNADAVTATVSEAFPPQPGRHEAKNQPNHECPRPNRNSPNTGAWSSSPWD